MSKLTVGELVAQRGESLQLDVLTGELGLDRPITVPEISSPGLVLAGFTARFSSKRLHVLGETEIAYLESLSKKARRVSLETLIDYDLPCLFVSKSQDVPAELLELAHQRGAPDHSVTAQDIGVLPPDHAISLGVLRAEHDCARLPRRRLRSGSAVHGTFGKR